MPEISSMVKSGIGPNRTERKALSRRHDQIQSGKMTAGGDALGDCCEVLSVRGDL